jgi:iron complex transport system substrate-binding protein
MRFRNVVFALFAVLCACTTPAEHSKTPPGDRRFVALVPSLAEDLYAIGAGNRVIGVSRFTDSAPASVARVADFQSVATERIVALHPDVVVAIPSQDRLLEPLRHAGIDVVLIPDDTYEDIFTDLRTLGELSGRNAAAQNEIAKLKAQTAQLQLLAQTFHRRPTVFVALGTGPIWTAGPSSYIGHLIALAGGADAARLPQPWGQYSEEALVRAQPDAIVSANEVHLSGVLDAEPWRSLRAVREGHVFTITDSTIVNALYRPGPRYNEGLRWLIERLTPLAQ